jgi:hypothetical protein
MTRATRTCPLRHVLAASLMLACAPLTGADGDDTAVALDTGDPGDSEAAAEPGSPLLDEPCSGGVLAPTRLAVTTTDGITGAVGLVDLRTGEVTPDLALGSSDALPFYHEGRVHVLHRFSFDALDVLAGDDLHLLGQTGLGVDGVVSSNPHDLAFGPGTLAHVTLFGAPQVLVLELADPGAPRVIGHIDLGPLADADGNPEAHLAIRCGDALFVSVQRLDEADLFAPTGEHDHLAPIDLRSGRLYDLDQDAPGVQPLPLRGLWAKQWRLDPDDPAGHSVLVLADGLERVDLADLSSAWAVDPTRIAAAVGSDDYRLPQAFALADAGATAYIASYTADFTSVVILRASLDDDAPLVAIASGLQSIERSLEVVDDTLWFGDRSHAAPGMRAWDLSTSPPTPRFAGKPLSTGLAPYAVVALP